MVKTSSIRAVIAVCMALAGMAAPQAPAAGRASLPALPTDPAQYVRQVIQHEMDADAQDRTLWRYRFHRESDRIIYDRDVIDTKDGQIARTLLINGQSLTVEQRANDEARLQRLLTDPDERAKHNKRIKDDADRARRMLRAVPDAFTFKYDGSEDGLVRLQFTPNPHYDPPSRELQVFHSMSGTLWIDPRAGHMARIDGQLIEDVNFGWGLLGKLKKGGTFKVVQKEVGPDHWEIVSLDVDMRGYAVLFKSISVKQHQVQSDFRRMPDDLTMARAYELLKADANSEPTATAASGRPSGK